MLVLNTFGPAFGEPDGSSFCTKAMCFLTMSGVEWKANPGADSRKAPFGKLPVLVDGDQTIADSDSIRFHLEAKHGADFDAPLNAQQRAQSRACIRMAEEHLYHCLRYDRWKIDANWAHVRRRFFSYLPPLVRQIVPAMIRRHVLANLDGQGLGKLSYEAMLARATLDLESIEVLLGNTPDEHPFLFGNTPVAADASVATVVAALAASPTQTGLSDLVLGKPRLMRYIADARAAIYPTGLAD